MQKKAKIDKFNLDLTKKQNFYTEQVLKPKEEMLKMRDAQQAK